MNRFDALDINNELRRLVTALFYYDDTYIDDGLRRYDITQALHLYLKRNGYETVVFYSIAKGFHSYEKEMLERFLSEVKDEVPTQDPPQVVNDVITSSKRGSRLLERKRRANLQKDDAEASVNVSEPSSNLYQEELLWRVKTANRLANMQQFIYNLRNRNNIAIVVRADETQAEFDDRYLPEFVESLSDIQSKMSRGDAENQKIRLIVMVNANHCRTRIMSLFNPQEQSPSVFLRGAFKSMFTQIPEDATEDEARTLNFIYSYVLPSPTVKDVRNLFMLSRFDGNSEKPISWEDIDSICEQFALKDSTRVEVLHKLLKRKEGYRYEDFAMDGIVKIGASEEELNALIGLRSVKENIESLKALITLEQQRGKSVKGQNLHMVFYGNPGTGKTTVARIIARIFKDLGILEKGHLVEVSREHLCGQYIGQTAIKTQQVIDSALGGVLFVDEAYRLARGGEKDYGQEAVDTLLARMENDRHRLVVILAGYENDMKQLLTLNEGFESRINTYLNFDDYNADELHEIFVKMVSGKYEISPEIDEIIIDAIRYGMAYPSRMSCDNYAFSNARWIRNLIEKIERKVALRNMSPDPAKQDVSRLMAEDFIITDMKEMEGFVPGVTKVPEASDIDNNNLNNAQN
jgi:hypothetical protein